MCFECGTQSLKATPPPFALGHYPSFVFSLDKDVQTSFVDLGKSNWSVCG